MGEVVLDEEYQCKVDEVCQVIEDYRVWYKVWMDDLDEWVDV